LLLPCSRATRFSVRPKQEVFRRLPPSAAPRLGIRLSCSDCDSEPLARLSRHEHLNVLVPSSNRNPVGYWVSSPRPKPHVHLPREMSLEQRPASMLTPLSAALPVRILGRLRPRPGEWVKHASDSPSREGGEPKEPGYQLSLAFCRCRRYPGATLRTNRDRPPFHSPFAYSDGCDPARGSG
jgi:hypothetical protein